MNSDYISLIFPPAESAAQSLGQDAQTLYEESRRLQNAMNVLLNSGMQGVFQSEWETRCTVLNQQLQVLCDETSEMGQDLQIVVSKAREVDTDCRELFERVYAGLNRSNQRYTPEQIQHNLDNWRKLRANQIQWIKELMDNMTGLTGQVNIWAGTYDLYQALLTKAERDLSNIDERISSYEKLDPSNKDNITSYEARILGFSKDQLLNQGINGSCVLYAAMNMLVQEGVPISQAESEKIFQEFSDLHQGKTGNFPMKDAVTILNRYGYKVDVNYSDNQREYNGVLYSDASAPVHDLITEVEAGRPVYVTARCDFIANWQGGHAMVVNGINLDTNGNLESVRVTTNWGADIPEMTIPANLFIEGWAGRGYGMIRLRGQQ